MEQRLREWRLHLLFLGENYVEQLDSARQCNNVVVNDRRIPFEEVERYFAFVM